MDWTTSVSGNYIFQGREDDVTRFMNVRGKEPEQERVSKVQNTTDVQQILT